MEFESAFRERLQHMEETRNLRLSQLQAEKNLQNNKSVLLSTKISQIRSLEQHCLILHHKLVSHNLQISSLNSEIDLFNRNYQNSVLKLRVLRSEVEELQQMEEKAEMLYSRKCSEMQGFKNEVDDYAARICKEVEELRRHRDELKSSYLELCKHNPDIIAAEKRKSELLALKDKVTRSSDSNNQVKSQLQRQLQNLC